MKVLKNIFHWFANHMPTKRRLIQIYTALLYNCNIKGFVSGRIHTGNSKYLCTPGLNCYSCPGAVAACPLGAMQNAFSASGTRAPFYMLGILGLLGLMLGRTICGFLCPVGLGQDLLYKIKTPKIKKSKFTRALSYVKYVILVVFAILIPLMYGIFQSSAVPAFCKYICPAGTFGGGVGLLINPANNDYFAMLGPLFTWKFCLMVAIIVFCVFAYRPFCRFICPLGAIYGFFNKIAIIGVKLDKQKCTDCGLCISHCKLDIHHVGDHECINCGECMSVCPVKAISWKGSRLFLKGNAYEEQSVSEERPLTPLLASVYDAPASTTPVEEIDQSQNFNFYENTIQQSARQADADNYELRETQNSTEQPRPKKGRNFYLQLIAFCLAFVVLVGAVLYFNVFTKPLEVTSVGVHDIAPRLSLKTFGYGEDGEYALLDETFDSYDYTDRILIINFWATWCGPCVAELPGFNKLQTDYPEVKVVAIDTSETAEAVSSWLVNNKPEFLTYKITFLLDDIISDENSPFYGQTVSQTLGVKDSLPVTVIIVKGMVKTIYNGSMDENRLYSLVESYL